MPVTPIGELVQRRLADDPTARGEKRFHDIGMALGRRRPFKGARACAGREPGHVDRILDRHGEVAGADRGCDHELPVHPQALSPSSMNVKFT
jgi:hypothetical protein